MHPTIRNLALALIPLSGCIVVDYECDLECKEGCGQTQPDIQEEDQEEITELPAFFLSPNEMLVGAKQQVDLKSNPSFNFAQVEDVTFAGPVVVCEHTAHSDNWTLVLAAAPEASAGPVPMVVHVKDGREPRFAEALVLSADGGLVSGDASDDGLSGEDTGSGGGFLDSDTGSGGGFLGDSGDAGDDGGLTETPEELKARLCGN
jgi:hypothetical protein